MKRGGQLVRRTPLRAKAPLRRYTELRSTPRVKSWTSSEGSAVSVIPPSSPASNVRCARRRPRAGHRLPVDVRQVVAERSGGRCEIRLVCCMTWAQEMHHRITQKMGGRSRAAAARSDRASNLLHACHCCHAIVTDFPGRAYQYGWSLREGQEPTRETVLYRGELVYLDDAGGRHGNEEAGA